MTRPHSRHTPHEQVYGPVSDVTNAGKARDVGRCAHCNTALEFETNDIGQVVERCPTCRTRRLFRGPPMITKADLAAKYGTTEDGEPRRQRGLGSRGKQFREPRRK